MTTRRWIISGAVAIAALVVLVVAAGAGDDRSGYRVRAVFANATSVVPGVDVKINGSVVGSVELLDVGSRNRAEVVLLITDPTAQRFYRDATCIVRLQSLIGEKFIQCDQGTAAKGELAEDSAHPGERRLPLDNTTSPVDIDLMANIMRLPVRERFRILISELGVALAGRGDDLNAALRRSSPALKQFNAVIKILNRQNVDLRRLVSDGDRVVASFARERKHIVGTFENTDKLQRAMLERRAEFEATLKRAPAFFDELEPTMRELGRFAKTTTPVARDLRVAAPDISRFFSGLGKFTEEADPAYLRLSELTEEFRRVNPKLSPIVSDLRAVGKDGRPASKNFAALLGSFNDNNGAENAMSTVYGLAGAMNGFDDWGHFIRAALTIESVCYSYLISRTQGCNTTFQGPWINQPDTAISGAGAATPAKSPAGGSTSSAAPSGPSAAGSTVVGAEEQALDYLLGGER